MLESREVPALTIQIDYSYDTGFFTNNPAARAVIEKVASDLGNSITSNLAAITPSGSNTWNATFYNPATGSQVSVANPTIGANTIRVYVGARAITGDEAGGGAPGGETLSGTQAWVNTVLQRGHSGFSPWGGSIAFDNTESWFFGTTTSGLSSSQVDFYSAALHEMGHVLGIGTAQQWYSDVSGSSFIGPTAEAVYGGPVPISPDHAHWADGITVGGKRTVMDPILPRGTRVTWSSLDAAALRDLGWSTVTTSPPVSPPPTGCLIASPVVSPPPVSPPAKTPAVSPPPVSPPAPPPTYTPPSTVGNPQTVAFTGGSDGTVTIYRADGGSLYATGMKFTPFAGYRGEIRVAGGDFDGDGVTDYAVSTGMGAQSQVAILSGRDGHFILAPTAIYPGYTGGLYIAAGDIDRDGKADLIVTAGGSASPVVQLYHVSGGGIQLFFSFVAFDAPWWRGGIRIAAGDINRDGYADLVVTTGSMIGAVAIYNGADLSKGQTTLLTPIFALDFPFGLNAAVGDMNGDGYADLALSFESGGPPVVGIWSGADITANPNATLNQLPFLGAVFGACRRPTPAGCDSRSAIWTVMARRSWSPVAAACRDGTPARSHSRNFKPATAVLTSCLTAF